MEAQIHIKALNFLNDICWLPEHAIEKQIAHRQIAISAKSASWFIEIKKLTWQYDLPDINLLLENPIQMEAWKKQVYQKVRDFWKQKIRDVACTDSSLKHLGLKGFTAGRLKLKMLVGGYVMQTNRAAFNQNEVKPTCLLCDNEEETLAHFLLHCKSLDSVRLPVLNDLSHELMHALKKYFQSYDYHNKISIILDCIHLVKDTYN